MLGKVRLSSMILAMTGILALGPAAAAVAAVQDPVPIGPNEYFSGLVNGSTGVTSAAVIQTNCFGPVQPGQTGHPLAGQSVEVELAQPPVSANGDIGFTGNATSITAFLSWPFPASTTPTQLVAKFSDYYVKEPIPVTLTVPCGGQGAVTFTPASSSTTGRPATVVVTFLSQP